MTIALSICAWIIAFLVGSFFGILRTVPNRFLSGLGTLYVELFRNVPLIVQFFTPGTPGDPGAAARENRHVVLRQSWIPIFSFSFHPCSASGAVYRRPCLRTGTRRYSSRCRVGKNAALAMGLTLPQAYRYVLLPNAYRVIVPPMTSEMMNLVKNSAIASTIGLVDMAAQAGKLLDYSAHAWESFTAITLAYVLINAFIMLVMTLVERKVRLPGNMGANNVRV